MEFCVEVVNNNMTMDWDSEVKGGLLREKAADEYSSINRDLTVLRKKCLCDSTISKGSFHKLPSDKQLLYVYIHNAYITYSSVEFADVVKLGTDVCEEKRFLAPCKEQNCHETYYPFFFDNDQCQFLCETLELPSISDAVNLLTNLPGGEAISYYKDDWTYRLHNCFMARNINSEYTADLRSHHVQKSWKSRLPEHINNNCLVFQGAPDIIIKTKKVDCMIVNSEKSDSDGDDVPSSQESARLQMGHQMNKIKPYVDASFQPNKVGELVAALHTSLSCRALRKYTMGQTFDSLEANGLFIHRSCGVIHMKVTLTKQSPMKITSILRVSGLLTPELFCSVMKYFIAVL